MEFKFNALISTVMLMAIVFAIATDCALINQEGEENYYQGVPLYTPSRECAMAGGICVQEGDCAKGQLAYAQKSDIYTCPDHEMGVACCYEVIPREAPCKHFGGECMDHCGVAVRQPLGIDCTDEQYCCILV